MIMQIKPNFFLQIKYMLYKEFIHTYKKFKYKINKTNKKINQKNTINII